MLHTYLRQDQVHINWNVYISFQLRQTWSCHARSESASMAVSMMVDTAKKNHIYSLVFYLKVQEINLWGNHCFSPPPKIRGCFLFLKFGQRGGSWKNCSEKGVSWKGRGPLRKRGFPNCFISFPSEKRVFITIRAYFNHLQHAVPTRSALFEK